jgi:hypothetical protein
MERSESESGVGGSAGGSSSSGSAACACACGDAGGESPANAMPVKSASAGSPGAAGTSPASSTSWRSAEASCASILCEAHSGDSGESRWRHASGRAVSGGCATLARGGGECGDSASGREWVAVGSVGGGERGSWASGRGGTSGESRSPPKAAWLQGGAGSQLGLSGIMCISQGRGTLRLVGELEGGGDGRKTE